MTNVVRYHHHVRDLIDFDENEIWALDRPAKMELTFDDREVVIVNTVDVIISWYYWAIASAYREIKITKTLLIADGAFTDDVHRQMLYNCIEPTKRLKIDREDVWLLTYREVYNKIYNAIATRLLPYMTSTTALDALELMEDPEIKAANAQVTDSLDSVDRAYDVIKRVMRTTKYASNPIVKAAVNNTVKLPQILQSIGPRGRITDIDSVIFRLPVKRGFAMGFGGITDFAKESRSAAKALLFNKDPVAEAEYFNRKLQLVCNVITHIVPGDCGTTDYQSIHVPEGDDGKKMVASLAGLNMLTKAGLVEIRKEMLDLRGTDIQFRTSLSCRCAKDQGVCETCYGATSYAIPHDTNPGHVSCTSIGKDISQLIISTKHLDFIVHKFIAMLRGAEALYLAVRKDAPESLYMNPARKGEPVVVRFLSAEASRLVDINYITDVDNMDVVRVSALSLAEFFVKDEDDAVLEGTQMDMVKHSTKASLSSELLRYMKVHGWKNHGDYTYVDLSNWPINQPLFVYPLKHESMSEFRKRTEVFLRSSTSSADDDDDVELPRNQKRTMLAGYKDIDRALFDAYYTIAEKLSRVHIGHIATILLASRVNDGMHGDWNMPSTTAAGQFRSHDEIIRHRSLSVAMLYSAQGQVYNDISCYLQHNRPMSIMDNLIYIE